jgi:hypothetical protein
VKTTRPTFPEGSWTEEDHDRFMHEVRSGNIRGTEGEWELAEEYRARVEAERCRDREERERRFEERRRRVEEKQREYDEQERKHEQVMKKLAEERKVKGEFIQLFTKAAVVEATYRELALKYHPDRGGSKETFQWLQEMYELVKRQRGGR